MNSSYLPLHHKYRPKKFDDLVGQKIIAATLKQALFKNRIAPAYLFCGPRGTGKTSSARILAKSLNCLRSKEPTSEPCGECDLCKQISNGTALDIIEIDAASNTGVDNIRDLIEKSKFTPVQARWKVYIIDECHMLSTAAFNALLKTLEEPPNRIVFVLATTDPQRLLPTIISRCQRFDFRHIPIEELINHLEVIASKENINIGKEALGLIAKRSQGGLRDAESMLDQLSLLPEPVEIDSVWELLGEVPEKKLLDLTSALINNDPISIIKSCRNLIDSGSEAITILQGLTSILRDLIIVSSEPKMLKLCNISESLFEQLGSIASQIEINKLFLWQSTLKGSENQVRYSYQPNLWLEVVLLGLLAEPFSSQGERKKNQVNVTLSKEKFKVASLDNKESIESSFSKENLASDKESSKQNDSLTDPPLLDLWEQILERVELPSTKMLLSQQAQLIKFSEKQAEVYVSANWLGMIQSRKNILEKAIHEAIGSPRHLVLNSQAKIKIDQSQTDNKNLPETKKNVIKKEKNITSEIIEKTNLSSKRKPEPTSTPLNKNEIKDDQTKQFANFFNGEIIDMEKDK